ncbi:MAG: NYN domain-containing protein [Streptosporangiaceae bacterium]
MLVDIENVVGGGVVTECLARWARDVVVGSVAVAEREQVIVGTSHVGAFNTRAAWPCARLLVRSGANGADLVLLGVMQTERIAQRFDEVVLVSGDGIFADTVAALGTLGVTVTVASWASCLSARLRLAAARTIYLLDTESATGEGVA